MVAKAFIRSGVGGRVSGLARRLVVLALIGAAFAAFFATSALAGDFELRPVIDSNQTVHVGHYYERVVRKVTAVYYTVNTFYDYLSYRLQQYDDLRFDAYGVAWAYPIARYDCYWRACPSPRYASALYRGWDYYWVLYRGYLWLFWQWVG